MKSFQEFLEEGRKQEIKSLSKKIVKDKTKEIKKQQKKSPNSPVVIDFGNPEKGSVEHHAALQAMMNMDSAWRKKNEKEK